MNLYCPIGPFLHRSLPLFSLILSLLVSGLSASPAQSQLAELAEDLLPADQGGSNGSSPRSFVPLPGGVTVFIAESGSIGSEVWRSDGTAAGTYGLIDSCTARCGAQDGFLVRVGPRALWVTNRSFEVFQERAQIWSTDGTRQGSQMVFEYRPSSSGDDFSLAVAGDFLFFRVYDEERRASMWVSDGTTEGTRRLQVPAFFEDFDVPLETFSDGELAYFFDRDDVWRSDGTDDGTFRIASTENLSIVHSVFPSAGKLFFIAEGRSFNEFQVVAGDGDSPGRGRVLVTVGNQSAPFLGFQGTDGTVFIPLDGASGRQLWVSDGTPEGTLQLTNFDRTSFFFDWSNRGLVPAGDGFVFLAEDSVSAEVWWTDGTAEGTRQVLPSCFPAPEPCLDAESDFGLLSTGSHALVVGGAPNDFSRTWITDGTRSGTEPLGTLSPFTPMHTEADGRVIFSATAALQSSQLWAINGPPESLQRLTRFPGGSFGSPVFSRLSLAKLDRGYLVGFDGLNAGNELWLAPHDGGDGVLLADIDSSEPGSDPRSLLSLGDRALFSAGTPDGSQLFRTEGEPGGAESVGGRPTGDPLVSETWAAWVDEQDGLWVMQGAGDPVKLFQIDLGTVHNFSPLRNLQALGDELYIALRAFSGTSLWVTDGTAAGTRRALEDAFPEQAVARILGTVGERLLLTSSGSFNGECGLWTSDGTTLGTQHLSEVIPDCGSGYSLSSSVTAEGVTYLLLGTGFNDLYLVATDGTPEGTVSPLDGDVGSRAPSRPARLVHWGDSLYWNNERPAPFLLNRNVWRYRLGGGSLEPVVETSGILDSGRLCYDLGTLDHELIFAFDDGASGCELWSLGASGEVRMVRDIAPGSEASNPRDFTRFGNRLFFAASDPFHGEELWVYESGQGARLVHDLFPGPEGSQPRDLTLLGDRLVFSADDGLRGRELWSLPLDGGPSCRASDRALCLRDGDFQVEARWRDFGDRTGDGVAVPLTSDTGTFWFFDPDNVEVALKVLDGLPLNEHFWTFYGALSNVRYDLTVTDTRTGVARRYHNPSRSFASVGDINSFGPLGASLSSSPGELQPIPVQTLPRVLVSQPSAGQTEGCVPSATRLCLQEGRYAVEVTWGDFSGETGVGTAVPLTSDTGYLWFFRDTNIELLVKVLNGQAANGHDWVFYGSLSNVDFDLSVTDTLTGVVRTYQNRDRTFASVGDTEAFPQ